MAKIERNTIRSHFFWKWFIGAVLLLIVLLLLLGGRTPSGSIAANQEPITASAPERSVALPTLNMPEVAEGGVLRLSGTGEPGALVAILADGKKIAETKVGPDGTWTLDVDALTPGEHNLQVLTLDDAGSKVNESKQISFTMPEPTPQPSCKPYIVQPGDWLTKLAVQYLGEMEAYTKIVEATNAMAARDPSFATITDPDKIEPGQKLCIPQS